MKIEDFASEVIANTRHLIGVSSIDRPFESWYAYISRLIRSNLLSSADATKFLPADWVKLAFTPDDLATVVPSALMCGPLDQYKLQPNAWKLFPSLCSSPPECLRGCPVCLANGYHSYAMQDDLLVKCPIHGCLLSHVCLHCGVPLVKSAVSPISNALRCPRGCSLSVATHSGLHVPQLDLMTSSLGEHLRWITHARAAITPCCQPVYIAYPPHVLSVEGEASMRPSHGLVVALIRQLNAAGAKLPSPLSYHAFDEGKWQIQVTRWEMQGGRSEASASRSAQAHRDTFRRGAFVTRVPICSINSWLAWKDTFKWDETAQLVNLVNAVRDIVAIELPSYLLTTQSCPRYKSCCVSPQTRRQRAPSMTNCFMRL
ncbi:hypothetical protein LMG31884_22160 [Xanthomonas hydrangeae]|uniref:hypothetical protein n=1 Tax=Xanthomonas hydrangeae TaxID=2775159 RepID=UPI001965D448|nr:hypothetical protein LMG31884_22160 [Xanthomonas hydrangeae]CAD7716545.1 hypothetical protein LMG31884_22160 [Xanthomonas hydrangeae]CAD7731975.1 hypothetical protein LMG31887_22150 [Xanthomonas hydrangeae]CAD7731978.1 hypothetical protein LMG31887_22150 [Xanthomonas hydrangeae]